MYFLRFSFAFENLSHLLDQPKATKISSFEGSSSGLDKKGHRPLRTSSKALFFKPIKGAWGKTAKVGHQSSPLRGVCQLCGDLC